MYMFWIVVIGFSMLALIMIYTYQFDKFDELWADYAGIDITLWVFFIILIITNETLKNNLFIKYFRQRDIGLVKYETKQLFLSLFYPTLLVVITVVQLQMFHKKYLERLELPAMSPRRESNVSGIQPSSSVNYGSLEPETPSEEQQKTKSHYTRINVSDLKNLTTKQVKQKYIENSLTTTFLTIFLIIFSHLGDQKGRLVL